MIWKKIGLMALAVCGVGFAAVPRASAGTEVVEPEYAPAPRYNYTPPCGFTTFRRRPCGSWSSHATPITGRGSAPTATATSAHQRASRLPRARPSRALIRAPF